MVLSNGISNLWERSNVISNILARGNAILSIWVRGNAGKMYFLLGKMTLPLNPNVYKYTEGYNGSTEPIDAVNSLPLARFEPTIMTTPPSTTPDIGATNYIYIYIYISVAHLVASMSGVVLGGVVMSWVRIIQ